MSSEAPKRATPWSALARTWSGFTAWLRARPKPELWSFAAISFATLCVAGFAGLVLGYVAAKQALVGQAKDAVRGWISDMRGPQDTAPVERSRINSNYHVVEVTRVPVGRAWSIAEVDGRIVFSSRMGRLGYLTPDFHLASIDLPTPLNFEALQASALGRNRLFEISHFRVTDILSVETGPGAYDLYMTHNLYDPAGCIRIAVSRAHLRASAERLEAASPDWDAVYRSRDCIQPKTQGEFFAGTESGGRLVRLDANRIALSIGDFQFDGVNSTEALSMNPASDLGKIIEINLTTGNARVMASGFRNPQGLLMTRTGMLVATDHGPRGGDELNIIRDGANYGWPLATYGLRYANRPVEWPLNRGAAHVGYEAPAFVFVPSVGISNVIQADPQEFPRWGDDLLIGSLRKNSLFRLHFVDGHVLYSEPMVFDHVRLRDLITLADGRIAIAADDGDIRILSDAETPERHARPDVVAGLLTLPAPLPDETSSVDDPARQGAIQFGLYCSQCHTVTGEARIGPPLDGVIGRHVGSYPGYEYSDALAGDHNTTWTRERLRRFATDPNSVYPGTAMDRPYTTDEELDQIIRFLETRQATPPQPRSGQQ